MRGTANVESPSRASTDLRAAVIGLWCINDTIAALNQTDNAVLQDGELQQTLVDYYNNLLADIVCRFQKTAALNVRSRLHYSSGGLDPSGNDGLLPAISGRREDFPQPAVRCGTDGLRAGVVNPPD